MQSTQFVSVALTDLGRTAVFNLSHIAHVDVWAEGARVFLADGKSEYGDLNEMRPLLAAIGYTPPAPTAPTGADDGPQEELQAPPVEPGLNPTQREEVRALILAMREEEEAALALADDIALERYAAGWEAMREQNDLLLEADWLYGSEQPGRAPLSVILTSAAAAAEVEARARTPYRDRSSAHFAAWKAENDLLFGAIRKAGLTREEAKRHAGASLILGFEVTSFKVLDPAELARLRRAVEADLFYSDWSLRAGRPAAHLLAA